MTSKVSTSTTTPRKTIGQELNYTLDYAYYDAKSHQAERIGDIWYLYDANGNVTEARQGGHSGTTGTGGQVVAQGDVRWTSEGFGLDRGSGQTEDPAWARYYTWDEENRLKRSVEDDLSVEYRYGADGQRAIKYSKRGENLYYDAMWSESITGTSIRQSKHVYVGQTRVATRLNHKYQSDTGYEQANTYYYHPDHLGSAQLVTDPSGQEYEHIEYTPYGELWVEQTRDGIELIPFRFTGKELDAETGLYYYGARYLDPKTSVWLSADPALGEYVPGAPIDDEAKKRNGNLPGMGGVFNTVNLHLYHYAGNNPIKYTDPDGRAPDKAYNLTFSGSVTVAKPDYPNVAINATGPRNVSMNITGDQSIGMTVTLLPGASISARSAENSFGISITNSTPGPVGFDLDYLLTKYSETGKGLRSELSKANSSWAQSSSNGRDAVVQLEVKIFSILASFAGRMGVDQAIAESLGEMKDFVGTIISESENVSEAIATFNNISSTLQQDIEINLK